MNSTHVYEQQTHVSEEEAEAFEDSKDLPIAEYLASKGMQIDAKLGYVLLYAIGNVNESQSEPHQPVLEKISTADFFTRISKYLRSIGLYGDNPMLLSNYGSSEYTQSLSRVGSIKGNMYVLNQDDMKYESKQEEDNKLTGIKLTNVKGPLTPSKGIIVGKEYEHLLHGEDYKEEFEDVAMQRMVIISRYTEDRSDRQEQNPSIMNIPPEHPLLNNPHPIRMI